MNRRPSDTQTKAKTTGAQTKKTSNQIEKWVLYGLAGAFLLIAIIIFICLFTGVFGTPEQIYENFNKGQFFPKPWSWLHILTICLTIAITAALVIFARKVSDDKYRIIIFLFWALIASLELVKQLYSTLHAQIRKEIAYNWIAMPFQLCSMPLYTLPFIALLKDGKIRRSLEAFTAIFSTFGGLASLIYADVILQVTASYLAIQTLIHHSVLIIIGIYIAAYRREAVISLKSLLFFATPPLLIFSALAIFANEMAYLYIPEVHAATETFNLFWISRHYITTLPILSIILPNVHYAVFLIIYVFGFILVGYIISLVYSLAILHKIRPCISLNLKKTSKPHKA